MPDHVISVCGGRYYTNKRFLFDTLTELYNSLPKSTTLHVVEGGQSGADYFARQWVRMARKYKWRVRGTTVGALWYKYGKSAGPIRNAEILDTYNPVLVLAFPGHKGTQNMIKQAKERGIKVKKTIDWSLYETEEDLTKPCPID